jgi:hypothetical protein
MNKLEGTFQNLKVDAILDKKKEKREKKNVSEPSYCVATNTHRTIKKSVV